MACIYIGEIRKRYIWNKQIYIIYPTKEIEIKVDQIKRSTILNNPIILTAPVDLMLK